MIEQSYAPPGVAVAARLASATATGVAFGILTLWLQGHLDGNWSVLGNSGAVWTVVAVATAAAFGSSITTSAAAGTLALIGEVAGYYWCAAPWHGIAVTQSEQVLWSAAALVIGPIAGAVGFGVARGVVTRRVFSLLAVAGLLAGEGSYGLLRIPQHHTGALVETVLGLTLGVAALLRSRATRQQRATALILGAAVGAAVFLVYTAPGLVV